RRYYVGAGFCSGGIAAAGGAGGAPPPWVADDPAPPGPWAPGIPRVLPLPPHPPVPRARGGGGVGGALFLGFSHREGHQRRGARRCTTGCASVARASEARWAGSA